MSNFPQCWCGNEHLEDFSTDYLRCRCCESLVARFMPGAEIAIVKDDARDFYGRSYWYRHQSEDYGYPDIEGRVRSDLPERCVHWLAALLRYKQPPARVLELGCGHGGFVGLLRWAGFEATGLELSPSIVQFAHSTFEIPILQGPVEHQGIPSGSLDVIVMMDVLEHLPDPVETVGRCMRLLHDDGILLVQTPKVPEGRSHASLELGGDPFLQQLKPREHLYLFSGRSARALFTRLGAKTVLAETPMFPQYDQFLVVSKTAIAASDSTDLPAHSSASQRLVQALLDLASNRKRVEIKLAHAEADRAARLEVIEQQAAQIEADREQFARCLKDFQFRYESAEQDRAARLEVIQRQTAEMDSERQQFAGCLKDVQFRYELAEQDRAARLEVIQRQTAEMDSERQQFAVCLKDVQSRYESAEQDRAARLEVIHAQGARLADLDARHRRLVAELQRVQSELDSADQERAEQFKIVQDQRAQLEALEQTHGQLQQELGISRAELEQQSSRTASLESALDVARAHLRLLSDFVERMEHSITGRALRRLGLVTFPVHTGLTDPE